MTRVLFRVDDGPGIGAGHLMRCLALAEIMRETGYSTHLSTVRASPLHAAWRDLGVEVLVQQRAIGSSEDLGVTLDLVRGLHSDWLVVDGYGFDSRWLDQAAGATELLYLDDLGEQDATARLVLNHNAGAELRFFQAYRRCGRALLGLGWFLLRSSWRNVEAEPEPGRLLVTLGGEDPQNLVLGVMKALLAERREFLADVVCAAPEAGYAEAQKLVAANPRRFVLHLAPVDLCALAAHASVAICGGGVTAVEVASLGIPPVIVVLADNQLPGATSLRDSGAAKVIRLDAGGAVGAARHALDLLADDAARGEMAVRCRRLVDGAGARRVLMAMEGTL